MEDSSKMLTQEEIDAMVSNSASDKPSRREVASSPAATAIKKPVAPVKPVTADIPSPAPAPVVQQQTANAHYECIAAGEIHQLSEKVGELSQRLSRIEQAVSRMQNSGTSAASPVPPAALKSAIQQIQSVSSQVEVITEGLRGTAGYNINKTYTCGSCGTMGVVAVKVKCTKCGQENWWGWWPKKAENKK